MLIIHIVYIVKQDLIIWFEIIRNDSKDFIVEFSN